MPKLSNIRLLRRLDPIDFLRTYLGSKPLPAAVRAEPFVVENLQSKSGFFINYELMEELIKESVAYRNFWVAASNLAAIYDRKGPFVTPQYKAKCLQEYNEAKRACENLDVMYLPPAKVEPGDSK